MTTTTINGVDRYIEAGKEAMAKRAELRAKTRTLRFDTIAVHGMYGLEEAHNSGQGGIIEPIFPSTSQTYRDSDEMEAALSYQIPTWCYSRIHNPTTFYLEETLALLESYGCETDATGLATSSGMSAIKQAVEPLLARRGPGDEKINFVSTAQVYGGTFQLFNVRMAERGAEVRWITEPWEIANWEPLIDEHTRFLYVEMPSNPQQACTDLEAAARLAHKHGIPLVVDATVATPALMRPLAHGADIVVHSLSKTAGAGGCAIAGAVIARHGITAHYLEEEQTTDYATWLKLWPFRDSGPCLTPMAAHYLLNEMRTLRLKVAQMSSNTMEVARFLSDHPRVERVDYLGLERIFRATDLGRIKSVATIPAISTHQHQGEEGRRLAGISPTMVRLCVGAEHPADTIDDLDQALAQI